MWSIITVLIVWKVLSCSRGKNLKQRFRIIWLGTKLFLLFPALIFFAVANVVLVYFLSNFLPLDFVTINIQAIFSLATIFLFAMLFWEKYTKWFKEIEEVT